MPSKVMFAQGNPFVLALMDALGLPKNTKSFEVRCALDEVVTVRCTYMPQADGVEGFDARPLVAEYKLVPASAVTAGDPAEAFGDEEPEPPPIRFIELPGDPEVIGAHVLVLAFVGIVALCGVLAYLFGR